MRKPATQVHTVGLVNLGCAKNQVDLQVMGAHLMEAGFDISVAPEVAQAVIINTCAFIEAAREEAVEQIEYFCHLKAQGQIRAVIVAGCFAQRYAHVMKGLDVAVDAYVGIDHLDEIVPIVKAALAHPVKKPRVWVDEDLPHRVFDSPKPALRFSGVTWAYLKIAEGCPHRCAYCAIPGIRGNYRSRTLDALVAETRALVESGVREINVVAQDPMLYGVDLKPRTNLVTLLKALDQVEGDFRVRVLYSYPSEITDEFLAWLCDSPRAIRYVDVPLQHTSPAILKRMGRGAAIASSLAAAARIRAAVPDVTLRTTVMTGFPGETEDDFKKLLNDISTMRFDHLGAFAFSPEEGTAAFEMADQVPPALAEKRCRRVMALQKKIWAEKANDFVGKVLPALIVDSKTARLHSQAPEVDGVVMLSKPAPNASACVKVRILAVAGFDFKGEIVV